MLKKKKLEQFNRGGIVIYKPKGGDIQIEVKLDNETIWLTQSQIALLFGTQRPAITKHLRNIFKTAELNKNSVSSILEHTAADGKIYKTQFYNLDAIISVGYRINSERATQFRIWATKIVKDYLIKGYAVNEKRLLEAKSKFKELQSAIDFQHRRKSGASFVFNRERPSVFRWQQAHRLFYVCLFFG
ncbi:MAG: RhuM family protein [bacterium]|nr:RhuM family protein [bacterium]